MHTGVTKYYSKLMPLVPFDHNRAHSRPANLDYELNLGFVQYANVKWSNLDTSWVHYVDPMPKYTASLKVASWAWTEAQMYHPQWRMRA